MATRSALVLCCFSASLLLIGAKPNIVPTGVASVTTSTTTKGQVAECYVEVRQTRVVPGRCLPIGQLSSGSMPSLCQSLDREYISVHNECTDILSAKREQPPT